MANQMLVVLKQYDNRIQFLRSQGDQLLCSIRSLEIGMNRRKQQLEQPHQAEIDWMYFKVKSLLGMLAEIKTCEYFKTTKKLVSMYDRFYQETRNVFFNDLIRKFNMTLKARRLNTNSQIDFSIRF